MKGVHLNGANSHMKKKKEKNKIQDEKAKV
jgi:hypothetical protein